VLNTIVEAGDRGIWRKNLKTSTNLHAQTLTKCLRELEGRKLVKKVKGVKVRYPLCPRDSADSDRDSTPRASSTWAPTSSPRPS
jgi:DNA-binding HxlR family transcriptional regulator